MQSILTSMSKSTSPGSLILLGSEHGLARGSFLGRPYKKEHFHFEFLECYNVAIVKTTSWSAVNRKIMEERSCTVVHNYTAVTRPLFWRLILTTKFLLLAGPCGLAAWRRGLVDLQLVLRLQVREAGSLHGHMLEVPCTSSSVTAALLLGAWKEEGKKKETNVSIFSPPSKEHRVNKWSNVSVVHFAYPWILPLVSTSFSLLLLSFPSNSSNGNSSWRPKKNSTNTVVSKSIGKQSITHAVQK